MSHGDTDLRIAIARVLERWQMQLIALESSGRVDDRTGLGTGLGLMLRMHIGEIKQCVTPDPIHPHGRIVEQIQCTDEFEPRIVKTIEWLARER